MPLESQNNQIENLRLSQATSKDTQIKTQKNEADDAYTEQIIAEATQQADETEEPEQVTIMVFESHEKMAKEVSNSLGLAFRVMLNSAIKYALFEAQRKGIKLNKFKEYPNSLGSHSLKLKVTAETRLKLKESGMTTEQLSECAVVGIELLHKRLIEI